MAKKKREAKQRPFRRFGQLIGLEGRPGRVPGWRASSPTEAMRVFAAKGVVTSAGETGCITVWKDRKGTIRAEFCRHHVPLSSVMPTSKRALAAWLREWWPHMSATVTYTPAKPGERRAKR